MSALNQSVREAVRGAVSGLLDTVQGFKNDVLSNLLGADGGLGIGFAQADAEAALRNIRDKAREIITPDDFKGVDDFTKLQKALDSGRDIYLPFNYTANGLIANVGKRVFGPGSITSKDGTSPVLTVNAQGFGFDSTLRGRKVANEGEARDSGLIVNATGFTLGDRALIEKFAYAGMAFGALAGDTTILPSSIGRALITGNGYGILTGDAEQITMLGTRVTLNGWNNARSGRSPIVGQGGHGVLGKLANNYLMGVQALNNVVGIELDSNGGVNPDHGSLIGCVTNHNGAVGLILNGLKNDEMVIGHISLSNVRQGNAAGTHYAPIAECADMVIIDGFGLKFSGCKIGGGSAGYIPIFGWARCNFEGGKLLAPPRELSHMNAGSGAGQAGYTVNADNAFESVHFSGFDNPIFFGGTQYTPVRNCLHNGKLIDGPPQVLNPLAGWVVPSDRQPAYCMRQDGDMVTIAGSVKREGVGDIAFTLPVGYRPNHQMDIPVQLMGATDRAGRAIVYINGDVQPVGAMAGDVVVINATLKTSAP